MIPHVQQVLEASSAVTSITSNISQTILPEGQTRPYVVWTLITAVPGINLSDPPDYDDQRVQVDCYSLDQPTCRALSDAVLAALESVTHVVFGPWADYEPDTKLFKWSMDAEFWDSR